MLTQKRSGVGSLSLGFFLASVILFSFSALAVDSDISVQGNARPSNVRTAVRPTPSARPQMSDPRVQTARPQPVMPRPIQDNTMRAPAPPQNTATRNFGQPQPQQQQQQPMNMGLAPPPRPRPPSRGAEQAVDLDSLGTSPRPQIATSGKSNMSPHGAQTGAVIPNFKFFYDFLLKSWKGGGPNQGSLTFDNYHQKMLVEYTPNQDFTFSASILGLDYYEVDYLVSPKFQLRWGKIWIPFDDMSPHNIFGGRVNTSRFLQTTTSGTTEQQFLPDIWADLGMAAKWTLVDSASFTSILHFYVVNGFADGGVSPVGADPGNGVKYPNFAAAGGGPDNNNNKALGGRWAIGFGPKFGLGLSYYTGKYTGNAVPAENAQGLTIMGGDMQIRPSNTTEIRVGITSMKVGLMSPAEKREFTRGGSYIELGQRFGQDNRWKFLVRAGKAQNDNRVVDVSDKTLVGMTLLKNFRVFEGQLTFYKDLNKVEGKTAYNYAALRLVTAF